MKKFYTEEMKNFLRNHYNGKTIRQIQQEFNIEFNVNITYCAMKSYLIKNNIKVGHKNNKKFKEEHINFLKENVNGITLKELTNKFNKKFNMKASESSISNLKSKYGLRSGIVGGRFEKGHVPNNKGKHMTLEQYRKCKSTMFKKGNIPFNYKPIGSERIDRDGYTYIKVAEPNKWKLKHRLLWENNNGPIPEKHKLIFADGNRQNICLDNLILVSYAEAFIMNQKKLIKKDKYLTKTGATVAKVLDKVNKRKRI